jgi:hypothetical protein
MPTWEFGGFAPVFNGPDFSPLNILQTDTGSKNVGNLFTLDIGTQTFTNTGAAPGGVVFTGATGVYSWAGAVTPGTYAMITRSTSSVDGSYIEYSWTMVVGAAAAPPSFNGPIGDVSTQIDATLDTSVYFGNAPTSYAISPAAPTGFTYNTVNGQFSVVVATSGLGLFGPFIVTATNAQGSRASNSFNFTVQSPPAPADYSDATTQAILDPQGDGTGIRIIRRSDVGATVNYYVVPRALRYRGQSKWVECLASDVSADRAAKIQRACLIADQPIWPLPV